MASDKNHRPCLPLKPQEKALKYYKLILFNYVNMLFRHSTGIGSP